MADVTMTIGGESVAGADRFDVLDPATGEAFAGAPACTPAQLQAAVDAADRAFAAWRDDEAARRTALRAAADRVEAHAGELAELLTREQGKPLGRAKAEVGAAVVWLRHAADLDLPPEVLTDDGRTRVEQVHRPLGVVAAITPWNYPVLLATWKLSAALRTGNTVVVKPSPYTPLSTLRLVEIVARAVPPGVVNAVSGGDDLGAQLTRQQAVRKISFTGSVATGKKVAAAAAEDLKRVTLELGGNDAAIVLPDVAVDRVARRLFWAAFENTGQVCAAIKRLYVHDEIFGDVEAALAELVRGTKVGPGTEPGVELGPINNAPQHARVRELHADALRAGAREIGAGSVPDRGYFFAPTLLTDVAEGTRIVDEEQFGPVLPLLRYTDVEDAVRRANATTFGLGASVWGGDADRAESIARRLEAGTVWVNQHVALAPHIPFGGLKHSGLGVENGRAGLVAFTDLQIVNRRLR